jgi:hypothetical protein
VASAQVIDEITLSRRAVTRMRREISRIDRASRSKYVRSFDEEFRTIHSVSSFDDLIIACYQADIVYIGDFHALPQSQLFAARLLSEIARRSSRTVLAVEMVYGRHQHVLDEWMSGELSEKDFLARIRYQQEWGYDWNSFKKIFDVARTHDLQVYGIDSAPRTGIKHIKDRDRHMAARIAGIFRERPEAKVVVLVGESHLATPHLPMTTRDALARDNIERRGVRVLQNLEEPYWRLREQGEEQVDTAKLAKNVYCVFDASPMEKYEAYRQVIERWNQEQPDDDEIDLTPSIYSMVDTILKFLKINKYKKMVKRNGGGSCHLIDAFPEVYSSMEAGSFTRLLRGHKISRKEIAEIAQHMKRNGSCYVPVANAVYIGSFNLVHGGEEAAHFVNFALRGDLLRPDSDSLTRADAFYGAVLTEALGFFGSKLIDPSRNHFFETSFYKYYRKSPEVVEKETNYKYDEFCAIIDFILLHKKFERSYQDYDDVPADIHKGIKTRSRRLFSTLTHELGYFLGQQIYDGVHEGVLDRKELTQLFSRRYDGRAEALLLYLELCQRLPGGIDPA